MTLVADAVVNIDFTSPALKARGTVASWEKYRRLIF